MRFLTTQRLVCLAFVRADEDGTTIQPLPIGWHAIKMLLWTIAILWRCKQTALNVLDRAANWLTCLPARLRVTVIILGLVMGELWRNKVAGST